MPFAVGNDGIITSIGERAARLLGQHPYWTVEAVFDRSFYIRASDDFVCIGDASIGDGPLNALLLKSSRHRQPEIGERLAANSKRLRFQSGTTLDLSQADFWTPPPWPIVAPGTPSTSFLRGVLAAAVAVAPSDSLIHAIHGSGEPTDLIGKRAMAAGLSLRAGLMADSFGASRYFDNAASLLLGLGHGLTPGGDDVLSGALIALHATRQSGLARTLAASALPLAPTRTSALSRAFLRAASEDQAAAALYDAVSAIRLRKDTSGVISAVNSIGHSSGFDMLAGALIGLYMPIDAAFPGHGLGIGAACQPGTNMPTFDQVQTTGRR